MASRSWFPATYMAWREGDRATSHYVTKQWDEVAMIKQDVARPSHRVRVQDLVRKERDLEPIVLWRAMRWRLEHRILSYGNSTVILN